MFSRRIHKDCAFSGNKEVGRLLRIHLYAKKYKVGRHWVNCEIVIDDSCSMPTFAVLNSDLSKALYIFPVHRV